MRQFTSDLRDLVQEFSGLTANDILARIAGPHPTASESRQLAMCYVRYSINYRSPLLDMVRIDIQVIEPLIRDLVRIGLEGGGLPPEALVAFKADGPATPVRLEFVVRPPLGAGPGLGSGRPNAHC